MSDQLLENPDLDTTKVPTQKLYGDDEPDILTQMAKDLPPIDSDRNRTSLGGEGDDLLGGDDPEKEEPEAKKPEVETPAEEKTPEEIARAKEREEREADRKGDEEVEKPAAEEEEEVSDEIKPAFEDKGIFAQKEGDAGFDEAGFDAETEEQSKGMAEKEVNKWKSLRGELKEFKMKANSEDVPEALQSKWDALQAKADEAEGLRQRVDELSTVSAEARLKQSPEYSEAVLAPAAELVKQATELEKSHELDEGIVRAIIRNGNRETQGQMIEEYLSDLPAMDKQEVILWAGQYRQLQQTHHKMLEKAGTDIDSIEAAAASRETAAKAERTKQYQDLAVVELDEVAKKLPGFSGSKAMEQARQRVLSIDLESPELKDMAYAFNSAVVLPQAIGTAIHWKEKYEKLEASLTKQGGSRPSVSLQGKGKAKASDEVEDDDDLMTAMRKTRF